MNVPQTLINELVRVGRLNKADADSLVAAAGKGARQPFGVNRKARSVGPVIGEHRKDFHANGNGSAR